jgi:uncharacterized protein YjcR
MEYLTPNDYEIAEQNGISKHNVEQRFYTYGWSKDRAITYPLKIRKDIWNQYKDQSVVSVSTFRRRLKDGMSPELAASTPRGKRDRSGAKLTLAVIQRAEQNGISYNTLKARVYINKWSVEKAVTFPVDVQKRKKCNA